MISHFIWGKIYVFVLQLLKCFTNQKYNIAKILFVKNEKATLLFLTKVQLIKDSLHYMSPIDWVATRTCK